MNKIILTLTTFLFFNFTYRQLTVTSTRRFIINNITQPNITGNSDLSYGILTNNKIEQANTTTAVSTIFNLLSCFRNLTLGFLSLKENFNSLHNKAIESNTLEFFCFNRKLNQ